MKTLLPAFILVLLVFSSCSKFEDYHESRVLPSGGWEISNVLKFSDSLPDNLPEKFSLELQIRHKNDYKYGNIWLYLRTETSDNTVRFDTVNWKLADYSGHWFGKGWGSLYSLTYTMPDLAISKKGDKRWFKIDIQHGLRDKELKGVESIGVRLSPLGSVSVQPQEYK